MPARKKNKPESGAYTKMPTAKQLEKLKAADAGFAMAKQNAVKFLESRRQAVYNIARTYHLDPDELMQEGFEVLLTCLRDFSPVYQKADGNIVSVQFTTFFGSRMDSKGMELRNTHPEYQARQAHMSDMADTEKARFREDPPLLVQHLDHENPLQEMLRGEASHMKDTEADAVDLKWLRDSFFDQKLTELIAREQDEKKRTILQQVKLGGVFNFQEMAYHFGVTDSRASQLLNELMDAFYIQRLIDGNLESVAFDFTKLKMNEKRIQRLVEQATANAKPERQRQLKNEFQAQFTDTPEVDYTEEELTSEPEQETSVSASFIHKPQPLPEVLKGKEQQKYPHTGTEKRKMDTLISLPETFRPPAAQGRIPPYVSQMAEEPELFPLFITETGLILDGVRRHQVLQEAGQKTVSCQVYHVADEKTANILRIMFNIRQMDAQNRLEKIDLYWAIVALAALGLSQQKIADALGTSRTNVIVYAKVKDKAAQPLRQLFEDGLIQITNASTCVEFTPKVQERIANFIRTYGAGWGKGSQFNELFEAAKAGKLTQLEKKTAASHTVIPVATPQPEAEVKPLVADAQTQDRLKAYETALRDAELWTAQRESVINRQTEELTQARTEIESLKKELEASELLKYGDEASIKEAMKELKSFLNLSERVAAATLNTKQAAKALRPLTLTRPQLTEVQDLLDELDQQVNTFRLEIANKARKKP